MNWKQVSIVYCKELKDTVRDHRTLISAILIPVLLFPMMTIGFGTLATLSIKKMQKETAPIMIIGKTNAPTLSAYLAKEKGLSIEPFATNYVELINTKKIRAAVEFPKGFEESLKSDRTVGLSVKIYHYAGEFRSQFAVRNIRDAVSNYRDEILEGRLKKHGLPTSILRPFDTSEMNVASAQKVGGNVLGGLIPYMVILLCLVGAINPAIDLTAGEKERGTIETILASPVSRRELVVGKFLLVLTASLVTVLISMASFALTFSLPIEAVRNLSHMGTAMQFKLSIAGVAGTFMMVFPIAVMVSAILLAISLFAKSFKEAQSYVSPLMILVILPAVAVMLPGIELNWKLAMIPILNVSLVCKELLTGSFPWIWIAFVFGSTCIYSVIALAFAVNMFKRESVLFRT